MMRITGASVFTEDGKFQEEDILIQNGYFCDKVKGNEIETNRSDTNVMSDIDPRGAVNLSGDTYDMEIIDARGCYAIPGLMDIHFHGCAGYDFCDGTIEAIEAIAAYEASVGVTTIIPATMTLQTEQLMKICHTAAEYQRTRVDIGNYARAKRIVKEDNTSAKDITKSEGCACAESIIKADRIVEGDTAEQEKGTCKPYAIFCGINLEGPFVSEEKLGAQNPAYLKLPDQELFDQLQKESGGLIKIVDLAPELPGAMGFIKNNSGRTVISLAHTAADYETAKTAFAAGATHVTHLFNAMNPFQHRQPGVIGAAADAGAWAELICDGIHVHPSAVRGALKLLGEERIIFISDSMMATGLEDGDYWLGGQPVKVVGRKAFLKDGTIAGSVTNLMDCMKGAVLEMDIPLETAIKCAAVNPAKHMGLYAKYGSITPGKVANLVLLDQKSLEVKAVFVQGRLVKS